MPYPEMMVAPMRQDLVRIGFKEMKTPDDVDAVLGEEKRTTLVAVNSVCGCAAAMMRPAVAMSLAGARKPEVLTTVFAGQDLDATDRTRDYITGYPPSSPSIALFKDGELAWFMERHQIEGRHPDDIAADLRAAYDEHC
jgi:putative YphP/YqiW family bacilliredoxin